MPKSQTKLQAAASQFFVTFPKLPIGDSEKRHNLDRTETERHNFQGAVYRYSKSIIYILDTPVHRTGQNSRVHVYKVLDSVQ